MISNQSGIIKKIVAMFITYKSFVRFALVGCLNTLVHLGILWALVEVFRWESYVASALGFCSAVILSFILNAIWTFDNQGSSKISNRLIKFLVISVAAMIMNTSLMYLFAEGLSINYLVSQFIVVGLVTPGSYFGNKKWTFKMVEKNKG